MSVSGKYECVTQTPMGPQSSTLVIDQQGDTFTGSNASPLGSADIAGTVEGQTLRWSGSITTPMPLTLDCVATVDGDALTGTVTAGAFGSFALTGKRVG
ncbi:MAG: hypothetical protein B7Z39_02435 [Novosphingobium sp. 12-64-8]|nr:MAG: hypothetical protein B7Z39_02435 [Novosphingobium sp. 12-64-8]